MYKYYVNNYLYHIGHLVCSNYLNEFINDNQMYFLENPKSAKLIKYKKNFINWIKPKETPEFTTSNNKFIIREPISAKASDTPVSVNKRQSLPFFFDYNKHKENQIFEKSFTGKYLAYKVLSLTVPKIVMPVDTLAIDIFYKTNFKDSPKDVFERYCKFHELDMDETLGIYRSTLKWNLIYSSYKKQNPTKKVECLAEVFLRLL